MDTMTMQEKRRIAREREQEADMAAAADLMGTTSVEDSASEIFPFRLYWPLTERFALARS